MMKCSPREACRYAVAADAAHSWRDVVEQAMSVVHDGKQTRWYSCNAARWEYLAGLDNAVAAIRTAADGRPSGPAAGQRVPTLAAAPGRPTRLERVGHATAAQYS
jgi:hypothetical protein